MTKAVIVGINNYSQAPLQGCVNDAEDMIKYLIDVAGFARDDIYPLVDARATKEAIVGALRDMIANSRHGDHLLFHYSGHGTQVESRDDSEPDGLDECLCPVDFDWEDPRTQLLDNELAAILAMVPSGVSMTAVLDSCHSGDMSRGILPTRARPRFLPWPMDIAFRLAGHKRVRRQRGLAHSSSLIVSACQSNELSIDTWFNDRANGAFTHHFLTMLHTQAAATLADLMARVTQTVAPFQMHPQLDGPVSLKQAKFLISPRSVPRGQPERASRHPAQVQLEQGWNTRVFGMNIAIGVCIALGDRGFECQLACNAGVPLRWSFALDGDVDEEIDVGAGFRVAVSLSNWNPRASSVSFDLAVHVAAPFLAPIAVARSHITLPSVAIARPVAVPTSPADLLAVLQLAQLGVSKQAVERGPVVLPREHESRYVGQVGQDTFAGGLFGCSYGQRMDAYVPPGFLRGHVEVVLDPPSSGEVCFVAWDDADPHIAQFTYHVACWALGGGKATFYLHCVREHLQVPTSPPDPERPVYGHNGHNGHNGVPGPDTLPQAHESRPS